MASSPFLLQSVRLPAPRVHAVLSYYEGINSQSPRSFFSIFPSPWRLCGVDGSSQLIVIHLQQQPWSPDWKAPAVRPRRQQLRMFAFRGQDSLSEEALKSTVELDLFLDKLRDCDSQKLPQLVAENVLAFDQRFWLRLATRAESCPSQDDKADMEELAQSIMSIIERLVQGTEDRINKSTDMLTEMLNSAVIAAGEEGQEFVWPPRDPDYLQKLKQAVVERERSGQIDEGFLSAVTAQLRNAAEARDKPGLVAMLQTVLQMYAAICFAQRSYAINTDGSVNHAEVLLEKLLSEEEERWQDIIRDGVEYGGGQVKEDELLTAVEKRKERLFMRTESGSYKQRVLGEYLQEVETRVQTAMDAFKSTI
eukprot:TRINITY_DN3487_c0_g1_i1.p1 TRINITY_DN3487_c0_g1~~TRINITY_DN3487_c0_g1_i1.p1  ORF type:complete len:388 (-),score=113.56 TRINITY_DN3487_c0_g1_i1:111-1205(-)